MTIPELAAVAAGRDPGDEFTLSAQEAKDITEAYTDASERCHVLTQELASERAENARLLGELAGRDRELAAIRTRLHTALYPTAVGA